MWLIVSIIRAFYLSSAMWVLDVHCCLYWHRFHQTNRGTLWLMVLGVNRLTLYQECRMAVFLARFVLFVHLGAFFHSGKLAERYCWSLHVDGPSPGVRVTVSESLIRALGRISEWCDLWGMKLNASKTMTMIVSRSRTMHPQLPLLTIGGTVLKESDDLDILDILGVTFDSKMTFEKHLRSDSRAVS